ncbi:hypothetical protein [Streptomyces sp. NPDC001389]|uniref:hypothetical protein n=1 Tax=Streptomyces sp. NPDC001389 TaxID=3364569 RepID=UPI0036C1B358
MNTTAAATQAHVTVATIRTWARRGIVAATKTAGRWIIDAASLTRRIAIGALKRRIRKEAPMTESTPTTDRKAVRAANKAAAADIRKRVLDTITAALPKLTGTDKQVAWAQDIRLARLTAALENLSGSHLGIHYALVGGLTDDPLRTSDIRDLRPWGTDSEYQSEAALVTAVTTALTHRGSGAGHEDRTLASWWIDHR